MATATDIREMEKELDRLNALYDKTGDKSVAAEIDSLSDAIAAAEKEEARREAEKAEARRAAAEAAKAAAKAEAAAAAAAEAKAAGYIRPPVAGETDDTDAARRKVLDDIDELEEESDLPDAHPTRRQLNSLRHELHANAISPQQGALELEAHARELGGRGTMGRNRFAPPAPSVYGNAGDVTGEPVGSIVYSDDPGTQPGWSPLLDPDRTTVRPGAGSPVLYDGAWAPYVPPYSMAPTFVSYPGGTANPAAGGSPYARSNAGPAPAFNPARATAPPINNVGGVGPFNPARYPGGAGNPGQPYQAPTADRPDSYETRRQMQATIDAALAREADLDPAIVAQVASLAKDIFYDNRPFGDIAADFDRLMNQLTRPRSDQPVPPGPAAPPPGHRPIDDLAAFIIDVALANPPGAGEAILRTVASNLMLNLDDEAYALIKWILTDESFREAQNQYLARSRLAKENYPTLTEVVDFITDVATTVYSPTNKLLRWVLPNTPEPVHRLVEEAVEGFGAGDTLGERFARAGVGLGLEGTIGGLTDYQFHMLNDYFDTPRIIRDLPGIGIGQLQDRIEEEFFLPR